MLLNLEPTTKHLRQFGFVALVAFGILGGWILWRGGLFGLQFGETGTPVALVMFGLGVLSALVSLLYPRGNLPLYVGLSLITYPIGWVVSHVVLAILFYGLFVPIGLVMRVAGRDVLRRSFDESAGSYWTDVEARSDPDRAFRQF